MNELNGLSFRTFTLAPSVPEVKYETKEIIRIWDFDEQSFFCCCHFFLSNSTKKYVIDTPYTMRLKRLALYIQSLKHVFLFNYRGIGHQYSAASFTGHFVTINIFCRGLRNWGYINTLYFINRNRSRKNAFWLQHNFKQAHEKRAKTTVSRRIFFQIRTMLRRGPYVKC